jgi:hypothetical protein
MAVARGIIVPAAVQIPLSGSVELGAIVPVTSIGRPEHVADTFQQRRSRRGPATAGRVVQLRAQDGVVRVWVIDVPDQHSAVAEHGGREA